jgi:hypothetical protein
VVPELVPDELLVVAELPEPVALEPLELGAPALVAFVALTLLLSEMLRFMLLVE